MKNKQLKHHVLLIAGASMAISIVVILAFLTIFRASPPRATESVAIKSISSQIQADGMITAENQATLHFQTGGKLVYLPVKEGSPVYSGQTIASLDTTILQKQLSEALNTYQSTRDTFDQTQANNTNNVLQGQQRAVTSAAGVTGDGVPNILNDAAKRILDQNQANLNISVLNVEIAQEAISLSTITSPLNGIVTHMDVTTPYVNVTPATSITVADPDTLVFRANVLENDIDYIAEGSTVTIKLGTNASQTYQGTVTKIYPDKITLGTGQRTYQVDIDSPDLLKSAKMGQSGTALITSTLHHAAQLVPTWTILNHDSVWVLNEQNKAVLRQITVDKIHGDMTEVTKGLLPNDRVITNPAFIASQRYQIL